jgi:hypothetical protein
MTSGGPDGHPARSAWIGTLFAAVFLALVGGLAVYRQAPPVVVVATAPADEFSAERAMAHVRVIGSKAHPMGSPEAARVREYLLEQLRSLGTNPQTQTATAGLVLENILGVLPGTKPGGPAVVLAAHSDSVVAGPGAGDDAAGVAAILETVRAVRAGPPLSNDLIVLITDGEERGLLGAMFFVEDRTWLDRVGLVLNFEARGNRGPAYMFETSDRNGWLIREYARAAPHPMGTSLAYSVYQRMPNSTDLTVFKQHGLKGLNFAFVEGVEHYHQPTDTPENLDARSLQHQGSSALALARHFGRLDLTLAASEPDAVYFHAMGPNLVVYPGSWVGPLAAGAIALFLAVAVLGLRIGRVTVLGMVVASGVALAAVVAATAASWGAWQLVRPWRSPGGPKGYQGSLEIAAGLSVLAAVVSLSVCRIMRGRLNSADQALGGMVWWLVLTVGAAFFLPGGSYLLLWPLVFCLAGVTVSVALPRAGRLPACLGAVPALVIVPPTLQAFCIALGPTLPFAASPLSALLAVALWPALAGPDSWRGDARTVAV